MKKIIMILAFATSCIFAYAQTQYIFVPNGTAGIGSSTNGFVGLGTTASSPASLLHLNANPRQAFRVYNNGNTTNYLSIWQGDVAAVIDPIGTGMVQIGYDQATNVIMGITKFGVNNGNIGIGYNTPIFKLHTISSVPGVALFNTSSTGNTGNISILNGSNYNYGVVGVVSGNGTVSNDVYALGYSSNANSSFNNVLNWTSTGNVGIGNSNPDAKLTVTGLVHAQEVKVTVNDPGPDYVFEKNYKLTALEEIKNYVEQNKHLPEVPSAAAMEKNGVQLGEMNMLLLKKIEELTLYVIEQNKKDQKQQQQIEKLLIEVEKLKSGK
jgi:hypothetical protein